MGPMRNWQISGQQVLKEVLKEMCREMLSGAPTTIALAAEVV